MKVIRTFVAVLIDEDLKKKISQVQEQVKKLAPDVKWVAPENFHVTLKFLGNVREDAISDVCAAVEDAARAVSPFDLSISGLGAFPNPQRARVVWVGIESGRNELSDLADAVDAKLAELGYEREERGFKAHITIGRVKNKLPGCFAAGVREVDAGDLGSQRIERVVVMQSELLRAGPVYSPLCSIELSGGN